MAGESVVLIVPTLNEAASIGSALRSIPCGIVHRVIVVDGGSTDDTAARARAAGAEVLQVGRGYGRACLAAAEAATDAKILVFMDGDGADEPAAIPDLIAPIQSGECDFVIGSRVLGEREPGSMSIHQVAAGVVIGWLVRLLYGVRYTDMSAFRAIRRDALLSLGMREMTYGWNLEMQMRAARHGLRVREIPVRYYRRTGGASKVAGSLRGTVKAGSRIVATFLRIALKPRATVS